MSYFRSPRHVGARTEAFIKLTYYDYTHSVGSSVGKPRHVKTSDSLGMRDKLLGDRDVGYNDIVDKLFERTEVGIGELTVETVVEF